MIVSHGNRCSFDYLSRDWTNVTFMWSVCASTYFVPLGVILFAYYYIVKAVYTHERSLRDQAKKMNVASLRSGQSAGDMNAEIRIAKVAMINVSLWVQFTSTSTSI
jgi:r-opsin